MIQLTNQLVNHLNNDKIAGLPRETGNPAFWFFDLNKYSPTGVLIRVVMRQELDQSAPVKKRCGMRKNSGFTLFELLTVIAIIAVISAIAIPNFINWLPKYRLGSAARNLLSAMQYARLMAVKENVNILVNFDPGNNNYRVFADYNSDNDQDTGEPTIRRGKMPGGIHITGTNFANDLLKFNSRGLAAGSGGTISITNNLNDLSKIRINRTGNSRILGDGEK